MFNPWRMRLQRLVAPLRARDELARGRARKPTPNGASTTLPMVDRAVLHRDGREAVAMARVKVAVMRSAALWIAAGNWLRPAK